MAAYHVVLNNSAKTGGFINQLKGDFGGLDVACWPLVPKFAGTNQTESAGFFRAEKSSARLPSEGK